MPASARKPTKRPDTPYGAKDAPLHVEGSWVWAPLKRAWLAQKPEEMVRQEFIYRLHTQWGYPLEQMRQEVRTQSGRGSSRADVVIAASVDAAADNRDWRIVVETKAQTVPINPDDYSQGESYGRAVGAEFLVMHNQKQTSICRLIPGAPGERIEITAIPRASELNNTKRLEEIRRSTKKFTRDEFQRLLFECHSILRNNHKMDPAAAFDEISKILFIKMAFEKRGNSEIFSTSRLADFAKASLLPNDHSILDQLFETTKRIYRTDQLFVDSDKVKISLATFKSIVAKLEKFNLSDTGDDVKGIAFEQFLGQTFRGELGQFFTPRPLVEFMVAMLAPQEGELVCDPASGTGGFLIRVFEYLREQVEKDIQIKKAAEARELEQQAKKEAWPADRLISALNESQAALNNELNVADPKSRMHHIAHNCIYGSDAEARAARTSKMNMIMHGDGHSGIYYHDGLLDVSGIFEGRFNVVLTNPPFGAAVGKDQIVGSTEQTRVESDDETLRSCQRRYGHAWRSAHDRLVTAAEERLPILSFFDIGRDPIGGPSAASKVRPSRPTEQLFIERCLNLLEPGGRLGIVLPDGILNNPSLGWLRQYVEGRARLLAVVSVPQEVFASSKATVKTSLVFLRRFTEEQEIEWQAAVATATEEVGEALRSERDEVARLLRRAETFDRTDVAAIIDHIAELGAQKVPAPRALKEARAQLRELVTDDDRERAKKLFKDAQALSRELDRREQELVHARARELTTHPVFMAEVESAGITSTGETGDNVPNELHEIVEAYKEFIDDPDGFAARAALQLAGTASEVSQ